MLGIKYPVRPAYCKCIFCLLFPILRTEIGSSPLIFQLYGLSGSVEVPCLLWRSC